ncbi:MAG: hypothetical protein PSX81_00895 [bacterium]|nr:hypothetical protein [bacterium]
MKKIAMLTCLFLVAGIQLNAQSEYEKKYFSETTQDTVKQESVVIVKDFEAYYISKFKEFDYKISVVLRTQYKLKDVYAVEAFSTMNKSKGVKKIQITQLKPNGNIKTIYINEDKEFKDDQTKDNISVKEGEDELAVEDLEIGDIIDYRYEYSYTTAAPPTITKELENGRVYSTEAVIKNPSIYRKLPDFLKFLQEKYPVLSSYSIFETPTEINLIQKAVNCDYKFTESKVEKGKLFECRIGYIKAYKEELFSYKYIDLPVLKYSLVNTVKANIQNLYPYQFETGDVKNNDVAKLGTAFYLNPKFLQKYLYYTNTNKDPKGYAYVSLNKFFSAFIKTFGEDKPSKLEMLNKFHDYLSNNDEINTWQFGKMDFAVLLARFCDKIKQPYKMMATMHKYTGKWEDIVHPSEINWGIYIKDNKNELFITSAYTASNIYERFGSLAGTTVILFNPKDKENTSTTLIYPEVTYENNTITYESKIELMKETNGIYNYHFTNEYAYKGSQKENIDDNISGNFYPDALYTYAQSYGMVSYSLYSSEMFKDSGVILPELRRINASYRQRKKDSNDENFKAFLYSDYHFPDIELDSFRIIEGDGYPDDASAVCKFKVEFNSTDVIDNTAGSFLLLKLGSLITEQLEISNYNNTERFSNVYNSNQKAIYWDIEVDLPKGYKPLNLSDFANNFENAAGVFKTTIVQDGQMLKLHVEKIYTTNYLPKEQWSDFVTFARQAVLFYEKHLLLEKQ